MRLNKPQRSSAPSVRGSRGYASVVQLLRLAGGTAGVAILAMCAPMSVIEPQRQEVVAFGGTDVRAVLDSYCVVCHNQGGAPADLGLDTLDAAFPGEHPDTWEKVITKLRTGTMPPAWMPRPDRGTYAAVVEWLETELDRAWEANPNPGRISSVHRLTRAEYSNTIRDLLALDIDVTPLLPPDAAADGTFDNMAAVLTISPAHLERYMIVARHVTRLAVGLPPPVPAAGEFSLPRDHLQEDMWSTDLPLGSRGGVSGRYHFPVDGEYVIRIRLHRTYQEYILGMGWPQPLDLRIDGELIERFTVGGGALGYRTAGLGYAGHGEPGFKGEPEWEAYLLGEAEAHLESRVFVEAGPRVLGVSFPRDLFEPDGIGNPPYGATGENLLSEQYMMHARVAEVRVSGPYQIAGPTEDTPSRREIFVCQPQVVAEEGACADEILSRMARRAYRRPVTDEDLQTLLEFFAVGRQEGGSFDAGIQMALERLLVDPDLLLRIYRDPPPQMSRETDQTAAGSDPYPLSGLELASRLSFFLWRSIPDEPLLTPAEEGKLTDPVILRQQAERMFADARAVDALVEGFATQWLNLPLLDEYAPNYRRFRGAIDRALLEAFPVETKMFVGSTLREDRSVLDLLRADYTYVNERLARHYGIPNVYGSRFRRVTLPDPDQRGGLLGHAGLLALTSYPDRTSPVLRGKWLLDNILDAPVPPPPDDVDTTLPEAGPSEGASLRERLEQHRVDPSCSLCHSLMDPLGFALEGYDAIGRWRAVDERGYPVDDVGHWLDGKEIKGMAGLRAMLLDQREQFVGAVTRKLMAYALGRELEYYDQPTVRRIVRDAAAHDYRWSAIILGITESPAFRMRAREAA